MARPTSMMSVALAAAAATWLLPHVEPGLLFANLAPSYSGVLFSAGAPASASGARSVPAPSPTLPANGTIPVFGSGVSLERPNGFQPIRFEWSCRSASAQFLFRNDSDTRQAVTFDVSVHDRLGIISKPILYIRDTGQKSSQATSFEIKALSSQAEILTLMFPSPLHLPALGFLKVHSIPVLSQGADPRQRASERVLFTQEIAIPERPAPGAAGKLFVGCLGVAGLILAVTVYRLKKKGVGLLWPMGSPTWNFQQSWGTNVTIASALLATVLTALVFPAHPRYMPLRSYSLLQSLFAALVILAPLLYGLIQRQGAVNQGYVLTFLLSGSVVLWAAFGQAVTLFLLLREFLAGNMVDILIGRILQGLACMLGLLLIGYGLRALYRTAQALSIDPAKLPAAGAKVIAPAAALAEWPLL